MLRYEASSLYIICRMLDFLVAISSFDNRRLAVYFGETYKKCLLKCSIVSLLSPSAIEK